MSKHSARIVVVGSINMDLIVRCDHLPVPGETILAQQCLEASGGKGANQAVAAARCGGSVTMIGRVGEDVFAPKLLHQLRQEGIDLTAVETTPSVSSGLAIVSVDSRGENCIVVVPGANGKVSASDMERAADRIQSADVLLLQLEIPWAASLRAIEIAREANVRVIFNPAPMLAGELDSRMFQVDLICPNQHEAAAILGTSIDSRTAALEAVRQLCSRGARQAVVTLGAAGAVWGDERTQQWCEPLAVEAIDTTAAGDAFLGALSVFWAESRCLETAIRFASVAGAIAATRLGAQPSLAYRREIEMRSADLPVNRV
jgi:ribokinase